MILSAHASQAGDTVAPAMLRAMSRRSFAVALASVAVAATGLPSTAASAAGPPKRRTVVGFHADAPWIDPSGRDRPYVPPRGTFAAVPDDISLAQLGHFL